jgi:hypothetical protein
VVEKGGENIQNHPKFVNKLMINAFIRNRQQFGRQSWKNRMASCFEIILFPSLVLVI